MTFCSSNDRAVAVPRAGIHKLCQRGYEHDTCKATAGPRFPCLTRICSNFIPIYSIWLHFYSLSSFAGRVLNSPDRKVVSFVQKSTFSPWKWPFSPWKWSHSSVEKWPFLWQALRRPAGVDDTKWTRLWHILWISGGAFIIKMMDLY